MSTPPPASLFDLSFSETEARLAADGVNPRHAAALWRLLYRGEAPASLPPPLRRWLEGQCGLELPEVADELHSGDGLTRKFLLRLEDGAVIETVLMAYAGRHTVCVSSQAGCAMGCVFCATGQRGFTRHLRAGEMVGQVLRAQRVLRRSAPTATLRNLVMMGMGEPLDNLEEVLRAMDILSDTRGVGLGPSRITLSTVGVVPGIRRLAETGSPYGLAVSLHGADEAERRALVPVSRRWPLAELMEACREYCRQSGRKIFFEWTLIEGKNDGPETAARLAELLTGLPAHVNLIPLNPTPGYAGAPSPAGRAFQSILRAANIPCTFRQRRGIDVAAGCGMLRG